MEILTGFIIGVVVLVVVGVGCLFHMISSSLSESRKEEEEMERWYMKTYGDE